MTCFRAPRHLRPEDQKQASAKAAKNATILVQWHIHLLSVATAIMSALVWPVWPSCFALVLASAPVRQLTAEGSSHRERVGGQQKP